MTAHLPKSRYWLLPHTVHAAGAAELHETQSELAQIMAVAVVVVFGAVLAVVVVVVVVEVEIAVAVVVVAAVVGVGVDVDVDVDDIVVVVAVVVVVVVVLVVAGVRGVAGWQNLQLSGQKVRIKSLEVSQRPSAAHSGQDSLCCS